MTKCPHCGKAVVKTSTQGDGMPKYYHTYFFKRVMGGKTWDGDYCAKNLDGTYRVKKVA